MIEQDYTVNRQHFIESAKLAGAKLFEIPYKRNIPNASSLGTDVAVLGEENASQVVVIVSGVHGVELPAGSYLQQIWLKELEKSFSDIKDTKFVFVHALNPHGAAFGMRTDWDMNGQGNIDPARNFVDFKNASNIANVGIENALKDADLSFSSSVKMWSKILYSAFIVQGKKDFKRGFVRGQYTNPDIPYFGGTSPSLTRLTWDKIIEDYVRTPFVKKIWHFDCHTGDGPFGLLQLYINDKQGAHVLRDASELIPKEQIQMTNSYFADIAGDIVDYWPQFNLGDIQVTPITLEFGTSQAIIEGIDVLNAILTRTILQNRYDDQHQKSEIIIQRMRDAFAPQETEWEKMIETQSYNIWKKLKLSL